MLQWVTMPGRDEKTLTVVFADLAGSSHLYDLLGDERALVVIAEGLEALTRVVTANGGRIIKTIGDEVMSVFENGDDAAEASSRLQEEIGQIPLPEELASHPLSVRIGLHTGPVVIEKGDVFGNTVNIAARLVSLAKAKQILTTRQTLEKLSKAYRSRGRFVDKTTVKGIEGEFEIIELARPDDTARTLIRHPEMSDDRGEGDERLVIRFGEKEQELSKKKRIVTIGRDAENDLVVSSQSASRYHARLEFRRNKFLLIDLSTNGTYVKPDGHPMVHVHRDEIPLDGSGRIGFGEEPEEGKEVLVYRQG